MTTSHLGGSNDCPNPIEAAVLMDYWLAALPSAAEEAVEQHLMTCDGCGERLREVIAMADGLRALARSGSLQVVISDQFVKHAAETGLRVREYAPPRGESVQCTVAADDDLLVARLAVDLTTASRVDVSWCDLRGHRTSANGGYPHSRRGGQRYLPAVHHMGEGFTLGDDDRTAPCGGRNRGRAPPRRVHFPSHANDSWPARVGADLNPGGTRQSREARLQRTRAAIRPAA